MNLYNICISGGQFVVLTGSIFLYFDLIFLFIFLENIFTLNLFRRAKKEKVDKLNLELVNLEPIKKLTQFIYKYIVNYLIKFFS